VFVGFSRIFLMEILIFKGLTARRLYKSLGFKGLTSIFTVLVPLTYFLGVSVWNTRIYIYILYICIYIYIYTVLLCLWLCTYIVQTIVEALYTWTLSVQTLCSLLCSIVHGVDSNDKLVTSTESCLTWV
jgi:hypothetical protein